VDGTADAVVTVLNRPRLANNDWIRQLIASGEALESIGGIIDGIIGCSSAERGRASERAVRWLDNKKWMNSDDP